MLAACEDLTALTDETSPDEVDSRRPAIVPETIQEEDEAEFKIPVIIFLLPFENM